ncbi:hypothetical protein K431DRAFT_224728 [Polychaeton citri CBS 116435]|uniref:Nicotinamide N-methyltransferase n=1 Tax=Polychaeton citri CBS 116435 TaxID=1314669 RepID=A0A9P4Q7U8_9PEZI|nr:hypothetical protein K431DRAFT_224728 [Polychaeton citri CBS 116435]
MGLPRDDQCIQHGDVESIVVYKSEEFGDIELETYDTGEDRDARYRFGNRLWNAGIKMAELISGGRSEWSVHGERVLELGAGLGLGGIVSILTGAQETVISDYPDPTALQTILQNTSKALSIRPRSNYSVQGHIWGELDRGLALSHNHHFTRVLAADCCWEAGQHSKLVDSMMHFLAFEPSARVYAVMGFHSGRADVAAFLDVARKAGLETEHIYEEDVELKRREWVRRDDGGRKDASEWRKWLVIARLKRCQSDPAALRTGL